LLDQGLGCWKEPQSLYQVQLLEQEVINQSRIWNNEVGFVCNI